MLFAQMGDNVPLPDCFGCFGVLCSCGGPFFLFLLGVRFSISENRKRAKNNELTRS